MTDILVFGAHPDDAEFGMGATIVKLVSERKSVAICVLTRGECGTFGTPEKREVEAQEAAKMAGTEIVLLDFKDCQIFDNFESRLKVAEVIRKFRPKIIFAPYHTNPANHRDGMAHPDHTALGTIVRHSARYAKFKNLKELSGEPWDAEEIIYYMLPKVKKPNCIVDVSEYSEKWEEVAKCHQSQLKLKDGNIINHIKAQKENTGKLIGVKFAEGFFVEGTEKFDISYTLNKSKDLKSSLPYSI